jgi:hypothetical protein
VRVIVGKVEAREGDEAIVSLDDGSTRRLPIPDTLDVAPGLSVRIIEGGDPDQGPFVVVRWSEDERVAERERLHGYVRVS